DESEVSRSASFKSPKLAGRALCRVSCGRRAFVIDYFDDHRLHDDHTGRSIWGGATSVLARAMTAIIQIGSVLFLARMLSPEDYGLVSTVMAFVGFAPLVTD